MSTLTPSEINEFSPSGLKPETPDDLALPLRSGLTRHGQFTPQQIAGRNFAIACVALEITQRCNLDCTLCYLSDLAEAVRDVPLFELQRRIKIIHDHYGDHTTVQITGGDPTLRSVSDLVEITQMIKERNMRAALFTNGIKANRKMLEALTEAGLDDVVFHVDLTQERKGYVSEMALNAIRLDYVERAAGLPLRVLFNTTVFDGNFDEIPDLVSFFCDHADRIGFCSFQMQADTGRGVLRERNASLITQQSVMAALERGVGTSLNFDCPLIGHPECNKYTSVLVLGHARANLFDDAVFFADLFAKLSESANSWSDARLMTRSAILFGLASPSLLWGGVKFCVRKLWQLRKGLTKGRSIHRINFFIHNFMDAKNLDRSRCESCVFMVATADGPLSMCVHNAKRDQMISQPVRDRSGKIVWNPLEAGESQETLPFKKLKGRMRVKANMNRKSGDKRVSSASVKN